MTTRFKITRRLLRAIRQDLERPHPFAYERVGFLSAGLFSTDSNLLVLAREYRPVADDDYLHDSSVGAMMGPEAIRKALQWAMSERVAIFHVHAHHGDADNQDSVASTCESKRNLFRIFFRSPLNGPMAR